MLECLCHLCTQVHHKIQNNVYCLNHLTIYMAILPIGYTVSSPECLKRLVIHQDSSNCNTTTRNEQVQKWQNNSLLSFSSRKQKELHLVNWKFIVKARGVVEDCMSNPRSLSLTYLEDVEKTILTSLIRFSIRWLMTHCWVKDLPQSVDIFYTYLSRVGKGIQFTKQSYFFPSSQKNLLWLCLLNISYRDTELEVFSWVTATRSWLCRAVLLTPFHKLPQS